MSKQLGWSDEQKESHRANLEQQIHYATVAVD